MQAGQRQAEVVPDLDAAFLAGIKEELASIEESEKNIQALSQVFRYYAKHAKQLTQVLFSFITQQCFPWELAHGLNLLDDILLLDGTGQYKVEFAEKIQALAISAFRKVPSEQEKREVAKMLHTWQELKIFSAATLEAVRGEIRKIGKVAERVLEEAAAAVEEEAQLPGPSPSPEGEGDATTASATLRGGATRAEEIRAAARASAAEAEAAPPPPKRPKASVPVDPRVQAKPTPAPTHRATSSTAQGVVDRILDIHPERPFDILSIRQEGSNGHDIRKAYRRIALLIHPDKNPGFEERCQEALIKLQQGREKAEESLQLNGGDAKGSGGETRCDATTAAATADVDSSFKCRYPGCDLPPCKQCANGCCTRNITHCHMIARSKDGQQCFFHPPPRAWACNVPP